jgi:hypothetical protein
MPAFAGMTEPLAPPLDSRVRGNDGSFSFPGQQFPEQRGPGAAPGNRVQAARLDEHPEVGRIQVHPPKNLLQRPKRPPLGTIFEQGLKRGLLYPFQLHQPDPEIASVSGVGKGACVYIRRQDRKPHPPGLG